MSDEQKTSGEEHIAALLKMAGPRPRIAEETRARVRGAVHEEWQRNVKRSRTRVVGWSAAAMAATAAIVFVVQRGVLFSNNSPRGDISGNCASLRRDYINEMGHFHGTSPGQPQIDFPSMKVLRVSSLRRRVSSLRFSFHFRSCKQSSRWLARID